MKFRKETLHLKQKGIGAQVASCINTLMSCVMNLIQNQNDSINWILEHSHVVRKNYFVASCFMVSIFGVGSQFNDGKIGRYHLLFHTIIRK